MGQRDRPAEIEVTPAMIEAGVTALLECGNVFDDANHTPFEAVAEAVIRAALGRADLGQIPECGRTNPKQRRCDF